MKHARINKTIAVFIALVFALQVTLPSVAFADQRTVDVENHTVQTDQTTLVVDITIDNIDKPAAGVILDDKATVTAADDITWEIPVIWVRDDFQIGADAADEGHTYLPALAFFVPQGYALKANPFTVTLSDSVSQLFGTNEIVSVYNKTSGITYIIPASLIGLFAQSRNDVSPKDSANAQDSPANAQDSPANAQDKPANAQDKPQTEVPGDVKTFVEIHCAQTARDALTDEDLEWLVLLIRDHLEPQAVNLLLDSFDCFNGAAKNEEIGKEISLYIYYQKGDEDGNPDHKGVRGAMAHISGDARKGDDGELKYCYMLGMDVDCLVKKDENQKPILNPQTGKCMLLREGEAFETLKNTIVHEMLHALMDDYNRTGMSGATDPKDLATNAAGQFPTQELEERYLALKYPQWFIEGAASAVESVYQLRYRTFQGLRRLPGTDGAVGMGDLNPTFTTQLLIDNYTSGYDVDGKFWYYDLMFAPGGQDDQGNEIETEAPRYVMGYLATLYLCDLAARYNQGYEGSSVKVVDGVTTVDSDELRDGLNSLLHWMHDRSTMDDLIGMLSPRYEDGTPAYKDTAAFQDLFIKGTADSDGVYKGDPESVTFVSTLLNYLLYLDNELPDGSHPSGSILEDFSEYDTSLLDEYKNESSDYLAIADSNDMTPSTVKSDTANIGAGKSNPDTAMTTSATAFKAAAAADATADTMAESAASAAVVIEAETATDEQTEQPTTVQPAVTVADDTDEAAPDEIGEPNETAPATEAPAPAAVEPVAVIGETAPGADEIVPSEPAPASDEPVAAVDEAAAVAHEDA